MAQTDVQDIGVATPKLTGPLAGGVLAFGAASVSVAGGANVTLTPAQYANRLMILTGAITANIQVIVPLAADAVSENEWVIFNNTTGAFTVTIIGSSGTGIVVATGKRAIVYADNTNVNRLSADI